MADGKSMLQGVWDLDEMKCYSLLEDVRSSVAQCMHIEDSRDLADTIIALFKDRGIVIFPENPFADDSDEEEEDEDDGA